jgi:pentapeptide MXKDX repeat protein
MNKLNQFALALLTGAFLATGTGAFAQDAMSHGAMSGDATHSAMHKDSMAMDHMAKPKTQHTAKTDAMGHDAMHKKTTDQDAMHKDAMGHVATLNDAMGK